MVFVHGWPDSAAEVRPTACLINMSATLIAGLRLLTHRRALSQWAAQFAHFCATGRFRCLAVTWQNFHPDLPDAPTDELEFAVTLQRLAATIQQAGLR